MITVYSAIYWWYDQLMPIIKQDIECRFVLFTDRHYYSKDWQVVIKDFDGIPNHLKSRFIKTHSHTLLAGQTIWIDGNVIIDRPDFVRNIVEQYKWWVLCLQNDERNSIAEEMDILKTKDRFQDQIKKIEQQREFYIKEWYKFDNWFSWNCVLMRDNTQDIARFNEMRWNQIIEYSYRDMLSMEFVSWYTKVPIYHLDWKWVNNGFMHTRYHLYLPI